MIHTILFLYLSLVPKLFAQTVKTIKLCEKNVAIAYVSTRGTVFEFPTEPEKVVLGTKNSFSIVYIKSDLAISPATFNSRSNLFVYLQGRRFVLDLTTSPSGGSLYFIKDCDADKIRPEIKDAKRK
jgi:hypothetical protein